MTLFVLKTESIISYEESLLDKFELHLSLQIDDHSAIITIGKEPLDKFRSALKGYVETSDLRSYISEIAAISIPKFDRISPEFNKRLDSLLEPIKVEVEILPNLGTEQYTTLIDKISSFIKDKGDEVLEIRIRDKSASIRGRLKSQTIRMVAQGVDSIWQTRQAPRIIIPKPQNISTEEALNSVPVSSNAKTICVLDTGTDLHHPLLRGVVLDAFDLISDNMPQDSNGHGTFITGLAAYGNLENRSNLQATARIISVKILGNNSDSYLENLLEQAVERFHNSTGIFTLSIMYNECCKNSEPTELTYTIDMLSRKHNVLFTICTGNITQDLPSLMKSFNYPTYFGDPRCRIFFWS